ncbi:hypothetical protein PLESTF_000084400 [Pleodorina starrii]|nr:hypothetical protein PLESTF_000084400 [Pleodorina starrii]
MPWHPDDADYNKFPWSIPLGRIFKIPVRLHVTYFIVLLAQVLGSIYYSTWHVLLWLIVAGPVLLLTILVHELGHCLAARSIGGTVDSITLWPLGGLAYMSYNTTYAKAIWVAAAGPLTHIPMLVIWLLLLGAAFKSTTGHWSTSLRMPPSDKKHFGHAICAYSVVLNLCLFLFNLCIPAYPLDGGRILTNALLIAGVHLRTTAIVVAGTAAAMGVAVFVLFATLELFLAIRRNKLAMHPLFASLGSVYEVTVAALAPRGAAGLAPKGAAGLAPKGAAAGGATPGVPPAAAAPAPVTSYTSKWGGTAPGPPAGPSGFPSGPPMPGEGYPNDNPPPPSQYHAGNHPV